jgi:hypothetical protein
MKPLRTRFGLGVGALLAAWSVVHPVGASSFQNWMPQNQPQDEGRSISSFGSQGFSLGGTDMDGDGVSNEADACNDTPAGAPVNEQGCPVDSDGDGVPDYLDRCGETPVGQSVDAQGCPSSDADGDGVPNAVDRCPDTPPGFQVDMQGCIIDTDRDGVPDHLDQCPGTPWGQRVGPNGCGEMDADGDGVQDLIDRCPNTPPGMPVGVNGCPVGGPGGFGGPGGPDEDGDGVMNGTDLCPGTPLGAQVDPRGCWVLNNVLFDYGKAALQAESYPTLENVVVILRSNPGLRLEVQGYTDNQGPSDGNRIMSEKRAQAVRAYLVQQGIEPQRVTAVGYGETQPVADNNTPEGRAANRRVELRPLP